jgi:hypothetical protein
MAIALLFSSSGFYAEFHICKGKVKSVGLFTSAPDCEMFQTANKCGLTVEGQWEHPVLNRQSCCSNQSILSIQKVENFKTKILTLPLIVQMECVLGSHLNPFLSDVEPAAWTPDETQPDILLYKLFEAYLI